MKSQAVTRKAPARREYHSALRQEQSERTRALLVDTAGEMVASGAMRELSLRQVAERAGVAVPTVYRHFPTRESFIAPLTDWITRRLGVRDLPASVAELPAFVRRLYVTFDENQTLMESRLSTQLGREAHEGAQASRVEEIRRLVRPLTRGMSKRRASQVAGMFRVLADGHTWHTLRRFGLDGDAAGEACGWAIEVLTRELESNPAALDRGDHHPKKERGKH